MRIFKYEIPVSSNVEVVMPRGAKVLKVDNQRGQICLWALVNTDQPPEKRYLTVVGTGREIHLLSTLTYIDTVVVEPFVWHVFERNPL